MRSTSANKKYIFQANAVANDCMKRMKQAEHLALDWQKKFDDNNLDLTSTRSDNDRHLLELTRLKAACDDQLLKIEQLTREVQKLNGKTSHSVVKDCSVQRCDMFWF